MKHGPDMVAKTPALAEALGSPPPPLLRREQAFEHIKDAIITGRLRPGTRLIERELCEALGASRTIVREVIRRLEAERLVQVAAHRGPRVAVLTAKTVREMYDLRVELESLLVREFVENATDRQIADLGQLVKEIKEPAQSNDIDVLVLIMRRFYHVLVNGAGNDVLSDTLEMLHARISRLRVLAMSEPGRSLRSVGEIGRIVRAIERRDSYAADQATRVYVRSARNSALRQLAIQDDGTEGEAGELVS